MAVRIPLFNLCIKFFSLSLSLRITFMMATFVSESYLLLINYVMNLVFKSAHAFMDEARGCLDQVSMTLLSMVGKHIHKIAYLG